VRQAAKLTGHARQRRVDDVLVQGRQYHHQQGSGQDQTQLPAGDGNRPAWLIGDGRRGGPIERGLP